jgi:hypothetical protein
MYVPLTSLLKMNEFNNYWCHWKKLNFKQVFNFICSITTGDTGNTVLNTTGAGGSKVGHTIRRNQSLRKTINHIVRLLQKRKTGLSKAGLGKEGAPSGSH